jgi:hypothetical protein
VKASYQVTGSNSKAPFTLKVHRGDGMALLAMNWRKGKPPRAFVGFSIEFREPGNQAFHPIKNRIGFPGQRKTSNDPPIDSTKAPFQKFRWVSFPVRAGKEGTFIYRVTPMFMNGAGKLTGGESQTASISLMRETIRGKLNVAFTRGYVSSQAFADRYARDGRLTTIIPDEASKGLTFTPTHEKADEALEWMGFEARSAIHELLDEAIARKAEVRAIAFDLNLPGILTRLERLGARLKVIIDDSSGDGGGHKAPHSPESKSAARLAQSAGAGNVRRQHMANLQHHKSIAVRGKGFNKVLFGSTNFSWRGFYVQSNHALVVTGKKAVDGYFDAFDTYFSSPKPDAFRKSAAAEGWHDLGLAGVDASVGYSPHTANNGLLASVGKDIDKARSSVLFSLAFLGQTTKGPIGPALGRKIKSEDVFTLGIADARVKAGNLGVTVFTPDDQRHVVRSSALTGNVPAPFRTEASGLPGKNGTNRGTRMHHKFVVLDFDRADARVYLGSYNFSEPADGENGENLLVIRDRTVATSFMIEALRLYDAYLFRNVNEGKKGKGRKILALALPPRTAAEKPWWQKYWDDALRKRDRLLFA